MQMRELYSTRDYYISLHNIYFIGNIISLKCSFAFSQALQDVLLMMFVESRSICVWVRMLLLPRCTLQVFKPKNMRDRGRVLNYLEGCKWSYQVS